jgi:predicted ATPase/DNA-binding CsgD family transcriptional regulator
MYLAVNRPLLCPEIIGRAAELAALDAPLEQTGAGNGGVALLAGEAGVGKSRLVAEVARRASERGFLVARGACYPADSTCPYTPLLELARALFAASPSPSPLDSLGALASILYPLLPDLIPPPADYPPLPGVELAQAKRRLDGLLARLFLSQTARAPVLLVIEDIHWSDASSLDVLSALARQAASRPLLVLVTYRQDEARSALRAWLAQLDRERRAREVQLAPLTRDEVARMLDAIFDERSATSEMRRYLHGELLETIYTLTDGNPFFVEETLSALMASGAIFSIQGVWDRQEGSAISIPRSVRDAVQRRAARLSLEARHVLTLAAVAGRQFDFALLQRLTHYEERQLLALMKELIAAQLVVEASADQFAFRHALTRQAISSQLLSRERRLLHQRIIEALEDDADVERRLEDLAYHAHHAGAWAPAADYARRAGEKALRLYAYRTAIDYLTWALEAFEHLSEPSSPAIYRARGQAYEALGEFARARRDYLRALETARAATDGAAEWQGAMDLGFLWVERDYGQAESWFNQALSLARALDHPALQARSLNRLGNWRVNMEQPQEAVRAHREALALFETSKDARGEAETLDLLGMASFLGGDLPGGAVYYQRAIERFRDLGDKQGLTSILATLALRAPTYQTDALVSAASLPEALQDVEQALAIARETGRRSDEAYALFQLGLLLGSQGEYGAGLAAAQRSLDIAEEIEHSEWRSAARTVLGGMYSGLLAHEEARAQFERAQALANEMGSLFWSRLATGYLASLAVARGNLSEAERLLPSTRDTLDLPAPAVTMAQRMLWRAAVELALAREEPASALAMIDRQVRADAVAHNGEASLRALTLRGEALAMARRLDEAEAALQEALARARAQGARPVAWRVALELASVYQSQGNTRDAERALATASALVDALAATVSDEPLRAHFQLQAAALFPRQPQSAPVRRDKRGADGLTAREREVAVLIAQGRSNQAIADALVITKRTVETHIANTMFKLGCSSRTQIAVWVVETGLIGRDNATRPQ